MVDEELVSPQILCIVRLRECCSGWQLQTESTVLFRKKYREYNERVQTVLPKERLLVYNVKQAGNHCRALCMFLGCEVPQESFSWANTKTKRHSANASSAKTRIGSQSGQSLCYFYGIICSFFFSFCYMKF